MDDYVVLTELGILPMPIHKTAEFLFPFKGFYFVSVPSANHHRKNHAIVIELNDDWEFVVYDPNEGRDEAETYARDCFQTGDGVYSYGEIHHLRVMEGHAGNERRAELYAAREIRHD